MRDMTSVQIEKLFHSKLKIISDKSGKKLYKLLEEAILYLEVKYECV